MPYQRLTASRIVFNVFNALFMTLVVILTLYPFLYILAASFSDQLFIQQGKVGIIPKGFNLDAYKLVFEFPMIGRSYWNTVVYTVTGTLVSVLLTVCAAYPLSRKSMLGRKFFTGVILLPMIFAGGIVPTFLIVNAMGMRNTIWAIIIPGAVSSFYVFIQRTFFEAIPQELEEAARIDGCSHMQILLRMILPLSLPSLVTIGLFYAVGQWNSFFPAMLYLSDKSMHPIQLLLRDIVIMNQTDSVLTGAAADERAMIGESVKFATIMVATVPILLVYPFIQKFFVQGAMVGSIKG
ncbi:carbohydrate ABC transporter permease [Paenibacillus caseinilyticus]|uniref:Sugar ABC transporter permease n=1 Tax=Paenibacillus mucilaginosus K02 TaxID=997761 RepID=I0BKT9_9BACL|nr:carbohydrate ABC transporter permease [Paenibacillus mucilaginosus]AFH62986.1 sugar ABC transporter permease [Paenibacillus mucilaginosus K02]WFA19279.1 carbohydrate ABC transporter permease [Paenibacillus mucilaginosus]